MRNKPRVFIDFDEVLVKSIMAFIETYKEIHRQEIEDGIIPFCIWEAVSVWNLTDEIPQITVEEINQIFDSPRLFDHLAFYADSDGTTMIDFLAELLENKRIDVFIASRGNPRNLELKKEFIKQKMPFFPIDNFIPMLGTDKMEKKSLSGLILLDDHQNNLYTADVIYPILMNFSGKKKEWNANAMDKESMIKCFTVADVIKTINHILVIEGLK